MNMGGIIGGVVAVIGGMLGTYASIKNTSGPREKSFMINCAVIAWIGIVMMLALVFITPRPYGCFWMIPFFVCLPFAIVICNRKRAQIKEETEA